MKNINLFLKLSRNSLFFILLILIITISQKLCAQIQPTRINLIANETINVQFKPDNPFATYTEFTAANLPPGLYLSTSGLLTGSVAGISGCSTIDISYKEGSVYKNDNFRLCSRQNLCFPSFGGLNNFPPVIDGKVESDLGWSKAFRNTHFNGTNLMHLSVQALRHKTDPFIYLSFEVKNDNAFDNDDAIVLYFRSDALTADPLMDRKLIIYPKCNTACNSFSETVNGIVYTYSNIGSLKSYKESSGLMTEIGLSSYEARVCSFSEGTSQSWNVEVKIPTSSLVGGNDWIDISDQFLFYYCVCRANPSFNTVTLFRWPSESPNLTGTDLSLYAFYPYDWGLASKGGNLPCKGVFIANPLEIGSKNSPSSQISLLQENIFVANVSNNTEIDGLPANAKEIKVTFKIANWGIPGSDQWVRIPSEPNPTDSKDISAEISNIPGKEEFNLNWTITDETTKENYVAHPHQCILVELNSMADATITTKGIYRNMDFVGASKFSRNAEVGTLGYGLPIKGFKKHRFLLNVVTQEFRKDSDKDLFDPKPFKSIKKENSPNLISRVNYNVHGYRYTGDSIIINGRAYDIIDPVGSYGYMVKHEGDVVQWKTKLTGAERIRNGFYKLEIFPDSSAIIQDLIIPIDFKKWSLSLHGGISVPTGNLATIDEKGINLAADFDYHFSKNLAMILLLGYNNFKSKSAGIDDTYWLGLNANVRYYKPLKRKWSVYAGAGPGLYIPETGNKEAGANIGLGITYDTSKLINFELGADFHKAFNIDFSFIQNHLGIVLRF